MKPVAAIVFASALLGACASVEYGDKSVEARLKQFDPVSGRESLYVCRGQAYLAAAGVRTVILVDNDSIGTVKPNHFVHAVLEPGRHGVLLRNYGLASGTGGFITLDLRASEVAFLWVGVTGKGFGVLTVDHFNS